MANWFSIVSSDISKIPDAILHYESELDKELEKALKNFKPIIDADAEVIEESSLDSTSLSTQSQK